MTRLCIAGSRDLHPTYAEIDLAVLNVGIEVAAITQLNCGMAPGVDMAAYRWARSILLPVREFHADWERLGKKAGPLRNGMMAAETDFLIVFWDGESKGTKDMMEKVNNWNRTVYVVLMVKR